VQTVAQTVEEEMDMSQKLTDEKVATLRALNKSPLQKAVLEDGNQNLGKVPVSPEILEFDKKFFHRQLDRIAKSY
jgi:hypothetical protein